MLASGGPARERWMNRVGDVLVCPLLESQVLVLNRLWQAVHVCSARRAFLLLYQGIAHVVSTDPVNEYATLDFPEWVRHSQHYVGIDVIGTVTSRVRIPKIVVLRGFDRLPKKEVKFSRQNVFERDGHT